jgi:hypothetical protein
VTQDEEGMKKQAVGDGLFALMSNEVKMSVEEGLKKYKYQPFVEKRDQQLTGKAHFILG